MRNIKGTLLEMSSDYTKNIIKLIFDNDIEKHSLRDSFLYSNFKNATFLNYQDVVDVIAKQEKVFLLFEVKSPIDQLSHLNMQDEVPFGISENTYIVSLA